MRIIPFYETIICSVCTWENIKKIITNLKKDDTNLFIPQKTKKPSPWKKFQTVQPSFLFHNSFLPNVYLRYLPTSGGSNIVIRFLLKKDVLLFGGIYLCLCTVMEIALLSSVLVGMISLSPVCFLPVGLIFFVCLLSMLCQKIFSRKILKQIIKATSGEIKEELRLCFLWKEL